MSKADYALLLRKVVIEGEPEVAQAYVECFRADLDRFVQVTAECLQQMEDAAKRGERTERRAWVFHYLYVAVNDAVGAVRLTVEGYSVPAGNLLRQLNEAIAVALLFSSHHLSHFARFIKNPEEYPVHDALRDVNKKKVRGILDVNPEGWGHLMQVSSRLNDHSHASAMGAATISMLDGSGRRDLGGNFDPAKTKFYQARLQLCTSAVERITELIPHLEWLIEGNRPGA